MRITYRGKDNKQYWKDRWAQVALDTKAENPDVYPLKYSQITVGDKKGKILGTRNVSFQFIGIK